MSKLLINEPPLQVLPSLAVAIGLDEAIALQQLYYWLNNPKSAGRIDENGVKWVYNTYAEWKEKDFPFWSEDKIQRTFLDLEKMGLVISKQLDAHKRDMRKFYRIDYDQLCAMDDSFLRPSIPSKVNDVKDELTETTTKTQAPKPKVQLPPGSDIGFMMATGATSEEIAAQNAVMEVERDLLMFYEQKMGYGTTLDWWGKNKDLEALRKFLVSQSREDIEIFAKWCNRPFSKFGPENAKRYPRDVITFWPLAFKTQENDNSSEWRTL